jgi:predicted TIM-barrel fold metal-dependent hydrolase
MLDLPIIDAHHHLWDLSGDYPWLKEAAGRLAVHGPDEPIRTDYLVTDYRADAARLDLVGSVHVDAGAGDVWAEARWLQGLHDDPVNAGLPSVIVAGAKLANPGVEEHLDRLQGLSAVRGVRDILNWHEDPKLTYIDRSTLMTDAEWLRGLKELERRGLSFDLQLYPAQMADAARLAADHPDLSIVLNHAGMPVDRDDDGLRTWRDGLRLLAAEPNVTCKISGIGMTDHHWTPRSLAPIVTECLEAFGAERSMFASNFPVDRLYSSMSDLYAVFDEITAAYSDQERRGLFAGNAARVYRLETRREATS